MFSELDAGACGITCSKLGEAEIMADAGIDDILLAFPIWGEPKLRRLAALRERARVRVSLDSPEVAAVPGVEVVGLLTLAGHAYHARTPEELAETARREGEDLVRTAELCAKDGIELREISVGSTPTARHAAGVVGVTEIRPGTYIFNDTSMIRLGVATERTAAARVLSTVIARSTPERVVFDAGTKRLTSDGAGSPGWIRAAGLPYVRMDFLNEEHGVENGRVTTELRVAARGAVR